jgi:hypothetical protein
MKIFQNQAWLGRVANLLKEMCSKDPEMGMVPQRSFEDRSL